ncbi:unnamed protein product [Aureobasidium pullulans]|nr:unnamed protein product [Aureobasidium pullulans]
MAVQSRVAAVTGANKGIGLAIASRGAEAVKTLQNDPQLKQAKVLAEDGGDTTITFHEFDVSDKSSIHAFRDSLQKEHPDGIDVLINNAGIAMEGFDSNVVKQTLATNYYGTLEATQSILPLIRDGGRLVNVSSMAGKLNKYTPELRDAFTSASQSGVPDCTALMQDFTSAVEAGKEKEQGWPSAAYAVSKAGTTAFTKAIAAEEDKKGRGVLVNACCPGYVNTDMTKGNGVKTPDQGAKTPVMLGLEDFGGSSGGFWQSEKIIEWLNITIANETNPILLCRPSACPEDIVSIISIHTRAVSLATYQFRLSR